MLAVSGLTWARRHKREYDGVITIEDPDIGRRRPVHHSLRFHRKPAPAHLILRFYDLDYPLPAPYHQPWMRLAEPEDIVKALAFAKEHESLLVHCKAGVGRSAGTALAILMDQMHDAKAALDTLMKLRPEAVPNRHVVALADQVLGCDGKLITVLDEWDQAIQANTTRRLLCRMAHFYEFGVPITAAHERGSLEPPPC
jgi:predicted protein tyrosine phosphatase